MTLSISEVAAATGLRSSALRYYEERGLIRPVGRRGGCRHYDRDVLSRLAFIALCQDVGFTLAETATLLDGRPDARARWQRLAERKLGEIQHQLERLQTMQRHLRAALACTCERVDGCQLVEDAAGRRRLHRKAP
jgi:MerR family transcriptional regulator, redox-sensitive transcriptional activator SoxR